MYTCKQCGNNTDTKPRFCQKCGSYFIDANDETDGIEWKGVIQADGTVTNKAKVNAVKRSNSGSYGSATEMTTSERVWGILGIIFSAHLLSFVMLDYLAEAGISILGIPFFVMGIIAARKSYGKMKRITILMLVAAAVLFMAFVLFISD